MRKWFYLIVFIAATSAQAQPLHEYGWTFYNAENKSVQHNFITDIEFDGINRIVVAPDSSIWLATWHHAVVVFSHKDHKKHKKIKAAPQPLPVDPRQHRQPDMPQVPIHPLYDD